MDEAEDRAAWERACLEATIRALEDPEAQQDMLDYQGWRVDDVRLEDSYPETAIVVYCTFPRTGAQTEIPFPLWTPRSEFQLGGHPVSPDTAALKIHRDMTLP